MFYNVLIDQINILFNKLVKQSYSKSDNVAKRGGGSCGRRFESIPNTQQSNTAQFCLVKTQRQH